MHERRPRPDAWGRVPARRCVPRRLGCRRVTYWLRRRHEKDELRSAARLLVAALVSCADYLEHVVEYREWGRLPGSAVLDAQTASDHGLGFERRLEPVEQRVEPAGVGPALEPSSRAARRPTSLDSRSESVAVTIQTSMPDSGRASPVRFDQTS